MNRDHHSPRRDHDHDSNPAAHSSLDLDALIDRLVGNELADGDRRALLHRLEATPDGWRRCALAFLEDQSWRSALAELAPEVSGAPPQVRPLVRPALGHRPPRALRFALAASVLALALGASFWAGTLRPDRAAPTVADQPASLPESPLAALPSIEPGEEELPPGQPLGWVGLVDQAEGQPVVRPVPYLASTPANAAWVESQPPSLSPDVRAQLERQGYQIEETHRLVDLDLQDGRRVAIPVDEVDVNFVGRIPL